MISEEWKARFRTAASVVKFLAHYKKSFFKCNFTFLRTDPWGQPPGKKSWISKTQWMSELLLSLLILEIMIKRSFRRLDNSTQPLLITSSFFFFFLFFRIVGVRRCLSLEWVKGNPNFRMLRRAIWFRQGNQRSRSHLPFLPPPHNNTWEVLSIVYLLDQHFEPPSGVLGVPSTLPTLINVNIFDILAISPKILCNKIHLTRFQNPRERWC